MRLFAGDRIYKILDRLGGVDDEGNEEPIEAGMLSKQIEKAQQKVEEQNFLIRKRVLEYDDVMNEQRRVIYAYRDEVLEGKSIGEEARSEVAGGDRADGRRVHRRATTSRTGTSTALFAALGQIFPVDARQRGPRPPRRVDQHVAHRARGRGRDGALRRARGVARRGADARARALPAAADHRRTLARAPVRHGLPARGHPPARLRPDRPARGLQERGLHAVRRPHEQRLGGLRADDLQRRGATSKAQNGGGPRRRPRSQPRGNSTRAGRVSYSGGHSAAGAGALAAAAAAAGGRRAAARRSDGEPSKPCRSSSSACSTRSSRSGATTPAGAGAARSSRSATAPERRCARRARRLELARASTPRFVTEPPLRAR